MKFTVVKQELVSALQIASKAIANKPDTPILSGIYLHAGNGQLEIQATDFELGILQTIPASVDTEGTIVLSGRYFQDIARRLPDDEITFHYDQEQNTMLITSGKSKFTLQGMDPNDFPTVKRIEGVLRFHMRENVLRALIKKTVFACSKDENRPLYTGCSIDINENVLSFAATNTYRIAIKKEIFPSSIGKMKMIVPARILNELERIMTSDLPSDIEIICSHTQISFVLENLYITSRLIEGQFPDFNRVIPKESTTVAIFKTNELRSAMERVSLISREIKSNKVRFSFTNGNVHISSTNPQIGDAEDDLFTETEGPELKIALNANFLIDALKVLDFENCSFAMTQPLNPIIVKDIGDDNFLYIVTPMRDK